MAATPTRLTLVVTEEMEPLLANAKKNYYYDKTRSEMVRKLVMAGLDVWERKEAIHPETGGSHGESENELGDKKK